MKLITVFAVMAMSGVAQVLSFEVASIKPSGPASIRGSDGGQGSSSPLQYR